MIKINKYLLSLFFIIFLSIQMSFLAQEENPPSTTTAFTTTLPSADYQLFWSDEFDNTVLDTSKWNYRGLGQRRQAINVKKTVQELLDGYHTFGLEWTQTEYIFYIDGEESWRTDQAISHRDQYIILGLEVGEKQKRIVERNKNFWDSVYFDYVRVYKNFEE